MSGGRPSRQVCPLCGTDDDVSAFPAGPDNVWDYTCTAADGGGHAEPYTWPVTVTVGIPGRSGITAELGLYDDLAALLLPGEGWIEHGILEHRYKLAQPHTYFDELIPRYGHVAQGPKRYTTSAFIAQALGQLAREGTLAWSDGRPTGFWSYNHRISYWALPPAPPLDDRQTWSEFATKAGLDPEAWILDPPTSDATDGSGTQEGSDG